MRRALSMLALLSAACGAPPPGPPPEPALRLVQLGGAAEVSWPPAASAAGAPVNLAKVAGGFQPAPGSAVEVEMFRGAENRDSRAALLAPAGSAYRFRLRLPPSPALRLALGHVLLPDEPPRTVTFRITVAELSGGEGEVVFEERLLTDPEAAWRDREIDLDAWAGREVAVTLATEGAAGDPPVWAAWGTPTVASRGRLPRGWDVILISLDTLRADRLGCYGYERRPTSPAIDAFAAASVRFATAVAQSPWTWPSHMSMLTGLYPISHGERRSLPLALMLWKAGYRTAAITGGGQLDRTYGFHPGFETYRVHYWIESIEEVVDHLEAGRDRRNFLFLHTYEIHDPYTHAGFAEGLPAGRIEGRFAKSDWQRWQRQLTAEEKAYVEALYDGGVAYVDQKLGVLFRKLDERGFLDRAIVIVTSDHGEQLWEHGGWRHGSILYDHQLLVPLIVHLPPELRRRLAADRWNPNARGRTVAQQVELLDLYPTVLDLVDVELPDEIQGRSLRPLIEGRPLQPRKAFSESTNFPSYERKSLRSERLKLIRSIPTERAPPGAVEYTELYDLLKDPGEQADVAAEVPQLVAALLAEMSAFMTGIGTEERREEVPPDTDPELRRQLEALGYFGD